MTPLHPEFILVRVVLDGVLVRCVSEITVQDSPGNSTCNIVIPWSPILRLEYLDRAHIFISYCTMRVAELYGFDRGNPDPGPVPSRWPRLFEGELVSYSEMEGLQNHQIQLRFRSFDERFEQTKLIYFDPSQRINIAESGIQAHTMFMGATKFSLDLGGVLSKTTTIWNSLKVRHETMTAEGSENIAFTSSLMDILRDTADYHPYFNYLNQRYKITERFASFADPDVLNILSLEALSMIADNRIKALTGNTNLLQIIHILSELMRYNWLQIAQPLRRERGFPTREDVEEDGAEPVDPNRRLVADNLDALKSMSRDLERYLKENQYGVTSQIIGQAIGGETNNLELDTAWGVISLRRLRSRPVSRRVFVDRILFNFQNDTQRVRIARRFGVSSTSLSLQYAIQYTLETLGYPSERKQGVDSRKRDSSDPAAIALKKVKTKQTSGKTKSESPELRSLSAAEQDLYRTRDILAEFAVIPNMEFSHPPRCNVILPVNMDSFGIQRDMSREITRLMARVKFGGPNGAEEWYVAPFMQAFFAVRGRNVSILTPQLETWAKAEKLRDSRSIQQIENERAADIVVESKTNK